MNETQMRCTLPIVKTSQISLDLMFVLLNSIMKASNENKASERKYECNAKDDLSTNSFCIMIGCIK